MEQQHQHTVFVLAGPTASGKTAIAVELAKALQTNIISADSRQCYKELNIGVAKPTAQELNTVPHYFINSHSIHDTLNAGIFEHYALASASAILSAKPIAILVGGTGLYIKAFCEGMDIMPEIDPTIRHQLTNTYKKNGLAWLQNEVKATDPLFWQTAEQQNPARLLRALEFFLSTQTSIVHFKKQQKKSRPFKIVKFALEVPKEQLHLQINSRVDKMIENGLVEEVKQLIPFKQLTALHTVGYSELFDYFDGKLSLNEAIEKIKINTKNYAKRQLTWFKKDKEFIWINPSDWQTILEHL